MRIDDGLPIVPISKRDRPVKEREPLALPDAKIVVPKQSKPHLSRIFGAIRNPAVAGVLAGAMLVGGAAVGAPLHAQELDVDRIEAPAPDRVQEARSELDRMLARGEVSADVHQRVRARLLAGGVPEDRGKVDLEALIAEVQLDGGSSRSAVVLRRLTTEIEHRMRVTARDMADPNTRFIEGAPGYKEISEEEVRDLVARALMDMPLEDLPLGSRLARVVARLPIGSGVSERMSANEIEDVLGDNGRKWVDRELRPLVEGHELEVGVVAFAAISGLRWASPSAADLMDGLAPSVKVYETHTEDRRHDARADLSWRDRHVFPDLDLTLTSTTSAGLFDLYGEIDSRVAPEADRILSGSLTAGARLEGNDSWIDASVSREIDRDLSRVTVRAGGLAKDFAYASTLTALVGNAPEAGPAGGRISWQLDATRPIRIEGADGSLGFYAGVQMDKNGEDEELSAGLVFRLRF